MKITVKQLRQIIKEETQKVFKLKTSNKHRLTEALDDEEDVSYNEYIVVG